MILSVFVLESFLQLFARENCHCSLNLIMQGVRWGSRTNFTNEALLSYMGKGRGYQSDESTALPLAAGEELRVASLLLHSVFIRHL